MQKIEDFNNWFRYWHPEAWAFVVGSTTGMAIFGFAFLVIGAVFKFGFLVGGLTLLSPWFLFLGFYIYKYWKENK